MAGRSDAYHKAVSFNVIRLAGLTTTVIGAVGGGRDDDSPGLSRGESEAWRQGVGPAKGEGNMAVQGDADGNRVRILVGENTLLGAIVMGDQALSRPLYGLVAHQADISPIRDRLLPWSTPQGRPPAAKLGDVLTDFWSEWRRGDAAQES